MGQVIHQPAGSVAVRAHSGSLFAALVILCPWVAYSAQVYVTSPLGDPVVAARVEAWLAPHGEDPLSRLMASTLYAETDTRGLAELPLPRVERVLVLIDHEDFAPLSRDLSVEPLTSPILLDQGAAIEGTVEFEGEQLENGTVCAKWVEDFSQSWVGKRTWKRCVGIDSAGRFQVTGLDQRQVDLEVKAPLFLPARVSSQPGTRVKLKVERGILVSGRVLDGARKTPIHAGLVRTVEENETVTSVSGDFVVAVRGLPTFLEVRAPSFQKRVVRVADDAMFSSLVIELDPATQIAATVYDGDGLPLEQVEVGVERHGATRESRRQRLATEEGRFVLDLERPGLISVYVAARGHREERLPDSEVTEGELIDYGPITLRRGAGLGGRILDAITGDPVQGVGLQLVPLGTQLLQAVQRNGVQGAVSDSEGRFQVSGLGGGRYELRARRTGYAPALRRLTLEAEIVQEIGDLMLERGTPFLARVVDRSGAPRAGLRVRLFNPENTALVPIAECTTDATGRCKDIKLASGQYRVNVSGSRMLLSQEVEIPAGAEEFADDLEVGGVHLTGVVRRGDNPVAGGTLSVASALDSSDRRGKYFITSQESGEAAGYGLPGTRISTRVEPDGQFEIEDAPPGGAWFRYLSSGGTQAARFVVIPDLAEADIMVDFAGNALRGRVVDADDGRGLEGALVRVLDPQGSTLGLEWSLNDGTFTVEDIGLDHVTVEVTAERYVSNVNRSVDIRAGAEPLIVPLESGGEGGLTTRLLRADGSPLAGVLATLLDPAGRMVRSLPTDRSGEREFRNLPTGEYFLVWSDAAAGTGISGPISVVADEPVVREVTVPPGSSIELVCASDDCSGEAIDHVAVFSAHGIEIGSFLPGLAPQVRFGAGARLSLGRLSPGHYHFRIWTLGRVHDVPLRVRAHEPAQVVIR